MTTIHSPADTDRALKARHRALWASGDYPAVAAQLISTLGEEIVAAAGIHAGQRVLDVAAGSGNAAIPAAERKAVVTASDLTPELFVAGRRLAAARGVEFDWVEADAEDLPFGDNSFDAVLSVVGAMFAPHHQLTADEMLRVTRPGGTLAMINWTPRGLIGNLFKTMAPYAPPSPSGSSPAPLWGDEQHVRDLFGDRVAALEFRYRTVAIDRFADPAEFREFWKRNYGPTIAVYRHNAADPDRVADLDRDFLDFLNEWNRAEQPGRTRYDAEYLVVIARKR